MSSSIIQCHSRIPANFIIAVIPPLLFLFAGCLLFEANENGEPAIHTEKLKYTLSQSGEAITGSINMTYTNRTGSSTYLITCHGVFSIELEKLVDGQWVHAYAPAVPECLGPIISIEPGRQHTYTLDVVAFPPSSNSYPKFKVDDIEGAYRVVCPIYKKLNSNGYQPRSGWGTPLPLEQRISNNFEITK